MNRGKFRNVLLHLKMALVADDVHNLSCVVQETPFEANKITLRIRRILLVYR